MLLGFLVFGTPVGKLPNGKLRGFGLLLSLRGVVVLITGVVIALLLALQFNLDDLMMIAACFATRFIYCTLVKGCICR